MVQSKFNLFWTVSSYITLLNIHNHELIGTSPIPMLLHTHTTEPGNKTSYSPWVCAVVCLGCWRQGSWWIQRQRQREGRSLARGSSPAGPPLESPSWTHYEREKKEREEGERRGKGGRRRKEEKCREEREGRKGGKKSSEEEGRRRGVEKKEKGEKVERK